MHISLDMSDSLLSSFFDLGLLKVGNGLAYRSWTVAELAVSCVDGSADAHHTG